MGFRPVRGCHDAIVRFNAPELPDEAGFAALRYFALNGTDHRTHEEQNAAIAAYVHWRNARAGPKTNFAQDSPRPSVDAISGQSGVTSGYATSRSTLITSITTAVAPWMP